ncbi:cytochrome c biogenesis protein ResB [Massilia sp. 2TAF26]|uniref:cytochrome c biogenesis protein ResB n=1 Tax=Massilia sp. 2TAF26 TaxID=3233012 RepID=UPI003F97AAEE
MKRVLNLLRSMRFAIGILAVVAVASSIGSILEQNQPSSLYVSKYGEVWSTFYSLCGLDDIYHAWWFFALLGFMTLSTGLCVLQNTPGMLRDMRSYRENKSVASLKKLEYSVQLQDVSASEHLKTRLRRYLKTSGYAYRLSSTPDGAVTLAARRGAARRAGYLLVHSAMVLICIGGLIDGNVLLRLRLWTGAAKIETHELAPSDVPAVSRLHADAGSFRATMNVAEGKASNTALVPMGDGYLLQELPFSIELKRFRVEHYASGQPKDFASDIEIVDEKGRHPATLQVNKPYTFQGVTLYQSGFADGGSGVELEWTSPGQAPQRIVGNVGNSTPILLAGKPNTIEFTDLRLINVFAKDDGGPASGWHSHAKPGERVHDVGPSLAFRVRDQLGQADEWLLYQKPAAIDGANWFLVGRRLSQESAMKYWRLPADANASLASYRGLVDKLLSNESRVLAAQAVARRTADPNVASALEAAVKRLLDTFATSGYGGVAKLVPATIPQEERLRTAQLYAQLLQTAAESVDPTLPPSFVHNVLTSYSETLEAKLPDVFHLTNFHVLNASGIQVTHAPGANIVYLGAALLALGVIAMYFVPERRLWLRVFDGQLLIAFTANRPGPGLSGEFETIQDEIKSIALLSRE